MQGIKKNVLFVLLLVYVFVVPIYYQSIRERLIDNVDEKWADENTGPACLIAAIWPIAAPIIWSEDFMEYREWKAKMREERRKARENPR